MIREIVVATTIASALAAPAFAQDKMKMGDHDMPGVAARAGSGAAEQMSRGAVRKVDKDAQKITIRHGPIDNLGMPPMTMVFRAQDAAMLDQVKPGDKVRFHAENIKGQFTVTRIEREQ